MPLRYVRVRHEGRAHFAERRADRLALLTSAPWDGGAPSGVELDAAGRELLAPVTPTKILGIGRNYHAHAKELGNEVPKEPLVFLKPPSSVTGPGAAVVLPRQSARVDYEGELGVVIGRRARNLTRETALDHVFGLVPLCDVTARDLQKTDGQWARAKGFDGFCPVGPEVVTGVDASALEVVLRVNGAERQRGRTRDMIFDLAAQLVWITAAMTLEAGDVIATGTPEGVGPLAPGDEVEVEVEPLGVLRFGCVADPLG